MQIDICIPTLYRLKKLQNCINSIDKARKNYAIFLYIYFSDIKEFEYFNNNKYYWIICRYIKYYKVPEFWNSHLQQMNADAMMYLNDDVLLYENTIEQIINVFETKYSDFDCLMGLNQCNIDSPTKLKGAFGVIGSKYADRFPDRKVFCPDYYRFFEDKEMELFAKSIDKFYYDSNIKLIHLHPCTDLTLIDETHKEVRKYLKRDEQTFYKRQSLNYLWGRDFNLLNQEE